MYVDTAFGGVNRRNNVRKLADVAPQRPVRLLRQPQPGHRRAGGLGSASTQREGQSDRRRASTARPGPTISTSTSTTRTIPRVALDWLRNGLDWLEARRRRPARRAGATSRGTRASRLEIPHTLFGGFVPSTDFHKRLRRAAKLILRDDPIRHVRLRQAAPLAPREQPPQQERALQDPADGRRGADRVRSTRFGRWPRQPRDTSGDSRARPDPRRRVAARRGAGRHLGGDASSTTSRRRVGRTAGADR